MFANLTLRERRLLKQAQVGATISFILLFVPILTISLLHTSDSLAKWLGIVGVIMVLPLLYFAWQILKIAYKDQKIIQRLLCGFQKFMELGFRSIPITGLES